VFDGGKECASVVLLAIPCHDPYMNRRRIFRKSKVLAEVSRGALNFQMCRTEIYNQNVKFKSKLAIREKLETRKIHSIRPNYDKSSASTFQNLHF